MDITQDMKALGEYTGLVISQDFIYLDNDKKKNEKSYLTYTYEDERPSLIADDTILVDTVYIQVHLFTPSSTNYIKLKHDIRDFLESRAFFVTSISTFEEQDTNQKHTILTCEKSQGR